MYICLSISLSICIYLPICSNSQSNSVCLYVCFSVCPSVCLSICPSVCLSLCPSVCLSFCLSVFLFAYLYVNLLVFLSVYLLSICLFIYVSVFFQLIKEWPYILLILAADHISDLISQWNRPIEQNILDTYAGKQQS